MGKTRRNPVTDQQILAAYAQEKVVKKVAKMLDIGQSTISRVLAKHGVNASGGVLEWRRTARLFDDAAAAELRRRYEAGETTAQLLASEGGSYDSIKRAIKRVGGKLRENPAPTTKPGEIEAIAAMYKAGASQQRISLEIGRSQSFVTRAMKRHDIERRPMHPGGAEHSQWKGGRWVRPDGYIVVMVPADDPLASMRDRAGYVLEHRLVMARSLGRPLHAHETVHHIDGNRQNNGLANLQLRQGRHGKGVVMECRNCGSHDIASVPIRSPRSEGN